MSDPSGTLSRKKVGTGKRLTPQERAKLKKDREKELRKRKREGRADKNNPRG
jgi:signal recognition particle subunit SRP54